MQIFERFKALWSQLCEAPAPHVRAELDRAYLEPHRAYHNWQHIEAMLSAMDGCRKLSEFATVSFDEVEAAIFFHDAIYDARAKDNEEQSAALFRRHAVAGGMAPEPIDRVADMILATAAHGPTDDISTRLLLDLDLAILGSPPQHYDAYVAKVRREYDFVPEDQWRPGRAAVLRRFLERPTIYQTDYFREQLEVPAGRNVSAEIESLEA